MSYRAYLRKRGVSYILAGQRELDCQMAMEKLYRLFHIRKLLICGGGADWSFLQAGMVDELSLVLSPVTDGSCGTASVFAKIPGLSYGEPVEFSLKAAERIGDDGLYLNTWRKTQVAKAKLAKYRVPGVQRATALGDGFTVGEQDVAERLKDLGYEKVEGAYL